MAKITVEFNYTTTLSFDVEADNLEDAEAKANELYNKTDAYKREQRLALNVKYDTTRFYDEQGDEIVK